MTECLAEQIEKTSLELMLKRLNGDSPLPINPFTLEDLKFDYSRVPLNYHASSSPDDDLILYKGALRGYEKKGLLSMALREGLASHVTEVKKIIEKGDDVLIHKLFNKHTSYYHHTALLSATFNPEEAQIFASTDSFRKREEDKTIYQIRIKSNRCVVDCYDTGNCGSNKELLILGAIFPEEITAIKIINDTAHSELITQCGHYIRDFPDKNSNNRNVKDSSNWMYLLR